MWWQLENPSLSSSRTSNEQPNQSNGTNTTQIIHISSQESTNTKSEKLLDNKMTIPTSEEFRKLSLENRRLELFSMLQTLLPLTERADALQDTVSLLSERLSCVENLGKHNKYKTLLTIIMTVTQCSSHQSFWNLLQTLQNFLFKDMEAFQILLSSKEAKRSTGELHSMLVEKGLMLCGQL